MNKNNAVGRVLPADGSARPIGDRLKGALRRRAVARAADPSRRSARGRFESAGAGRIGIDGASLEDGAAVGVEPRPTIDAGERALVVGDDPTEMESLASCLDAEVIGRVRVRGSDGRADAETPDAGPGESAVADPAELESRLRTGGATVVALAFADAGRAGFYRTLCVCRRSGVRAIVPNRHAEDVLPAVERADGTVEVRLEPWGRRDRVRKRAFDVAFSALGLLLLPPLCLLIAAAIKLEDSGPVFYKQRRTSRLGRTFDVYKFRTMVTDAESDTGAMLSAEDAGGVDPRVTRVGRVLRRTHLDEIPQLWPILVGEMSVVGPRPERPELDPQFDRDAPGWRRRWFVKPGLTGLAQIQDITSHRPATKLRYDLAYVRRQSFALDVRIVCRQLGGAVASAAGLLTE